MTDLIIAKGERGQRYLVQISAGIDLQKLAGELVIVSVPDNMICHPLIPGNRAAKIIVNGTQPIRSTQSLAKPVPKPPPSPPKSVPSKLVQPQKVKPIPPSSPPPPPLNAEEISELLQLMRDEDKLVRVKAIAKAKKHKILEATDAITRRLLDCDPQARAEAASACTSFGFGESANLVVKAARLTPEQWRTGDVMRTLRKHLGGALLANEAPHRQYHAIVLVGQLRISSLIPDLLPFCNPSLDVAMRRAVADTLWQIGAIEAIPLLLLLSVDSDTRVRRYAAAALADLEEFSMSHILTLDLDQDVCKQSRLSFGESNGPWALTSNHRLPVSPKPTISPLATHDVAAKVSMGQILNLARPLLNSNSVPRQRAGLIALLWAGGAASYKPLKQLASSGCTAAITALKTHFGVEPVSVPKKTLGALNFPKRVPTDSYQNAPHRNRHPAFCEPFPCATLLIIGGDGREEIYRRTFARTPLTIIWRSGFAPESITEADLRGSMAVVLVANEVSAKTYQYVLALLLRAGDVPCAYSQTARAVSIARTARTLLNVRRKDEH